MANQQSEPKPDQELVDLLGAISKKPIELTISPPTVETKPEEAAVPTPAPPQVPELAPNPDKPTNDDIDSEPPLVIDASEVPIEKPPIEEPVLLPAEQPVKILTNNKKSDLLVEKQQPMADNIGVRKLLEKFGGTLTTIVENYDKDRNQINEAIDFYSTKVRNAGETKGMAPYVEGWVHLLKAKGDINLHAVSALDSISKLLAASKSNDLVINLGDVKKGDLDLEELLSRADPKNLAEEDGEKK